MASNKSNAFDRFRFIKPGAPRPASNKTNDDAKPKARPSSSSSPSSGKTAAAAPEPPRKKARIEDEDDEVDDSDSFGARDLELPAYSLSDDDDEDYSEPAVPEPETAEPEPPSRVGPQQWADFVRPISWKPHGDLSFQILECEDAARDRVGSGAVQGDNSPLIRLFGITADGYSVTAFVKGFYPFLLFPVTRKFDVAKDGPVFKKAVEQADSKITIHSITKLEKDPLFYYRPNAGDTYRHFIQIKLVSPWMINRTTKLLETADEVGGLAPLFSAGKLYDTQVYEANISHDLRFMVESGIVGGGWCTIPRGKYRILESRTQTRCSVGVVCAFEDVIARNHAELQWASVAGHRIFAVSVTQLLQEDKNAAAAPAGPKGSTSAPVTPQKPKAGSSKASTPAKTPAKKGGNSSAVTSPGGSTANEAPPPEHLIGVITVLLTQNHTEMTAEACKDDVVFVFCHTFSDYEASHPVKSRRTRILRYEDEAAMLVGFFNLFKDYDPDIVTGFDVTEQFAVVMARAAELRVGFNKLGRIPHLESKTGKKQIYRADWVRAQRRMAGTSNREFMTLTMTGRIVLDSRQIIERDERLRSYTLADCVMAVLGITKETLDEATLTSLFRADKAGRKRLIDYCEREVHSAMDLVRRGASYITYLELARVTGLNISATFQRGQMVRFWCQLFRYCKTIGVAIPTQKQRNESQIQEGSLVMMPEAAYDTTNSIAVLDFRSLYPSIIIGHNLCFSTLLKPADRSQMEPDQYEPGMAPEECYFVRADVKKGIVPSILEIFLEERRKVRKQMAEATDPVMKTILNGRQLALKISANAIYGAVGSRESPLQCLPIAETTIKRGATMLQESKEEIERTCIRSEGFEVDAQVVYGDTDSLFVRLPDTSVKDAFRLGKDIAARVSKIFPDPIQLEFQSVFFPSLLINRKRYCAMEWTNPDKPNGVTAKGIESQRRDSAPILITMMSKIVDILMPADKDNSPKGKISAVERAGYIGNAVDYTKWAIRRMLEGKNHAGEFVLTKGLWLGTESGDYKAKQAHVELVERMRKREPWREFKDGERISFVYVAGSVTAKAFEKSEDPAYALKNDIPLDYPYYLAHQIEQPLTRIFDLILSTSEVQNLFKGDHTKVVARSSGAMRKGSIATFFSKGEEGNCVWCRRLTKNNRALCDECEPYSPAIYSALVNDLAPLQKESAYLHGICGQCQRSRWCDVLCTSEDCDIFFRRLKNSSELERLSADVSKLEMDMYSW